MVGPACGMQDGVELSTLEPPDGSGWLASSDVAVWNASVVCPKQKLTNGSSSSSQFVEQQPYIVGARLRVSNPLLHINASSSAAADSNAALGVTGLELRCR